MSLQLGDAHKNVNKLENCSVKPSLLQSHNFIDEHMCCRVHSGVHLHPADDDVRVHNPTRQRYLQ